MIRNFNKNLWIFCRLNTTFWLFYSPISWILPWKIKNNDFDLYITDFIIFILIIFGSLALNKYKFDKYIKKNVIINDQFDEDKLENFLKIPYYIGVIVLLLMNLSSGFVVYNILYGSENILDSLDVTFLDYCLVFFLVLYANFNSITIFYSDDEIFYKNQ